MESYPGGARRAVSAAVDICFEYPCAFSARLARLNSHLVVANASVLKEQWGPAPFVEGLGAARGGTNVCHNRPSTGLLTNSEE